MLAIHEFFFFGFGLRHPLSSSGKQVVNIYTSTTVRSLSSVYERKFRLRLATHMDTVTELFSPSHCYARCCSARESAARSFQTVDRTVVRRLERKRQTELTATLISVTYAV